MGDPDTRLHNTNSSNGPCAGPNAGGPYAGPMVLIGPCAGPSARALAQDPCNAGALVQDPYRVTKATLWAQRILKEQRYSGDRARGGAGEKGRECIAQDPSSHSPKRTILREPAPYMHSSRCNVPSFAAGVAMRLPNERLSLQLLSPAAIAHEFGMHRIKIEETYLAQDLVLRLRSRDPLPSPRA